jgi:hypothetical protein
VEDWAEIRRLHRAEGMSSKAIVRQLGISRNTVRRALAADCPLWYQRPAKGSIVDKDRVRELRPLFIPPDPALRTGYQPGELAQCDLWFPPADVPLGFGAGRERSHTPSRTGTAIQPSQPPPTSPPPTDRSNTGAHLVQLSRPLGGHQLAPVRGHALHRKPQQQIRESIRGAPHAGPAAAPVAAPPGRRRRCNAASSRRASTTPSGVSR